MARQMMLQQLFVEERIRSDGDSGIKQIRYVSKALLIPLPVHYIVYTFCGNINSLTSHDCIIYLRYRICKSVITENKDLAYAVLALNVQITVYEGNVKI